VENARTGSRLIMNWKKKIGQPAIRQSRQPAKRSYPPSNPLPAVTGGGVGKGSDFRTRTRTCVTRDRNTAV
jgi:hypothetical protein